MSHTQAVLLERFGCTKYQLSDQMRNHFHIDDKYLGALKVYNMCHISGQIFNSLLHDGMLTRYNRAKDNTSTEHAVIYHHCTPYNTKRAAEIRLSFRAAKEEFNLEPIVLVEIVSQ